MDNPKYIQVMRQVASDFDGISHELFQVASDLERMDQYNPSKNSLVWLDRQKYPRLLEKSDRQNSS